MEDPVWDETVAPKADGLYDPALEKEACGVGFVVQIDGIRSNKVNFPFFFLFYLGKFLTIANPSGN